MPSLVGSEMCIRDRVRRPLQNPYDGPFPVLEAGDKVFKVLRNGVPYTVSVDRLKPCHLPSGTPMSSVVPNRAPPRPPQQARAVPPPMQASAPSMITARGGSAVPDPPSMISARIGPAVPVPPPVPPGRPTMPPDPGSESPVLDVASEAEFPPLPTPIYTSRGRISKPTNKMNL